MSIETNTILMNKFVDFIKNESEQTAREFVAENAILFVLGHLPKGDGSARSELQLEDGIG